jgi:hypothetical protein
MMVSPQAAKTVTALDQAAFLIDLRARSAVPP